MKHKQRLNSLLSRALQLTILCCGLLLSKAYSQTFSSDIPLLQPQHLTAEYWLAKVADADQVLLSVEQINEFNRQTFLQQPEMLAIAEIPMSRSASELSAVLQKVSAPPGSARFFADGRQLGPADWAPLLQQLNPEAIQPDNPTRFGLVTQRALMRAVPSELRVFNEAMALD
ncbi:MAG: glycoside hydrolase, partial [Alishewanella sp. 32-51-5]